MTPLEKCARAMEAAANEWAFENDNPPWDCPYPLLARACLTALMEPTEEMLEAALTTSSRFGRPAMRNIWQAILNSILENRP